MKEQERKCSLLTFPVIRSPSFALFTDPFAPGWLPHTGLSTGKMEALEAFLTLNV